MLARKSSLILKEFHILDSQCEYIPYEASDFNFNKVQVEYSVDIDFNVAHHESDIIVFTTVIINSEKISGYFIQAESIGVFSFEEEVSQDDQVSLVQSAISICVTNLRSYIANMTSYYLLGRYNFPAIDMVDLLHQKMEKQKQEQLQETLDNEEKPE